MPLPKDYRIDSNPKNAADAGAAQFLIEFILRPGVFAPNALGPAKTDTLDRIVTTLLSFFSPEAACVYIERMQIPDEEKAKLFANPRLREALKNSAVFTALDGPLFFNDLYQVALQSPSLASVLLQLYLEKKQVAGISAPDIDQLEKKGVLAIKAAAIVRILLKNKQSAENTIKFELAFEILELIREGLNQELMQEQLKKLSIIVDKLKYFSGSDLKLLGQWGTDDFLLELKKECLYLLVDKVMVDKVIVDDIFTQLEKKSEAKVDKLMVDKVIVDKVIVDDIFTQLEKELAAQQVPDPDQKVRLFRRRAEWLLNRREQEALKKFIQDEVRPLIQNLQHFLNKAVLLKRISDLFATYKYSNREELLLPELRVAVGQALDYEIKHIEALSPGQSRNISDVLDVLEESEVTTNTRQHLNDLVNQITWCPKAVEKFAKILIANPHLVGQAAQGELPRLNGDQLVRLVRAIPDDNQKKRTAARMLIQSTYANTTFADAFRNIGKEPGFFKTLGNWFKGRFGAASHYRGVLNGENLGQLLVLNSGQESEVLSVRTQYDMLQERIFREGDMENTLAAEVEATSERPAAQAAQVPPSAAVVAASASPEAAGPAPALVVTPEAAPAAAAVSPAPAAAMPEAAGPAPAAAEPPTTFRPLFELSPIDIAEQHALAAMAASKAPRPSDDPGPADVGQRGAGAAIPADARTPLLRE